MILWLAAAAFAACDPAAMLPDLRKGEREAYMCFATEEAAKDVIVTELAKGEAAGRERLTRALALWLLTRTDREMDPALVEKLEPADRRLLADGIRARRGRASPAPEHAKVFEQFSWYTPDPTYTDGKLRPLDRANLAVVDPPRKAPEPPKPAGPVSAVPEGEHPAPMQPIPAQTPNLCGCDSGATGAGWIGVVAAILWGRTRRG